ncbi:MAG: methyltransferase domain-containing protein [Actinomycetota bacterium]|nr:methyltransferase domain-containing protein [Actinomycetota bacterium]
MCGAVIAPWILDDSGSEKLKQSGLSEYCQCQNCGLHFFSKRFTDGQLERMYSHYRDKEYQKNRQRYEPWYTEKFNSAIGNDPETIELRRKNLFFLVNKAVNEKKIRAPKVVVDWGGDKGQFIPDFPNLTKRLVYEVSNSVPIEGVARTDLIEEVKLARPDLVLLCHVLEHDHGARETIHQLSQLMIKESVLYIEVPEDRSPIVPRTKRNSALLSFLLRHRIAFIVFDAYSLFTIRVLGKKLPFQFLKQSEHVNFFCRESIVEVTQEYGFEVVAETRYSMNQNVRKSSSNALGLLLRKI